MLVIHSPIVVGLIPYELADCMCTNEVAVFGSIKVHARNSGLFWRLFGSVNRVCDVKFSKSIVERLSEWLTKNAYQFAAVIAKLKSDAINGNLSTIGCRRCTGMLNKCGALFTVDLLLLHDT